MKHFLLFAVQYLQNACHDPVHTWAWTSCTSRMFSFQSCKSCTSSWNILFEFRKCRPIPISLIFIMVAQSMSWWHAHSSIEVHTMRQISGTASYWYLVSNIIVIIEFFILDANLGNATNKLGFWKVNLCEEVIQKIECKDAFHLIKCNNKPTLPQFLAMRSECFFKGKLAVMIVVVVFNRMTTKIIPVHVSGVINLHQVSSSYTAISLCLWEGCQPCVCHGWHACYSPL